jgi:hypothetical protein
MAVLSHRPSAIEEETRNMAHAMQACHPFILRPPLAGQGLSAA